VRRALVRVVELRLELVTAVRVPRRGNASAAWVAAGLAFLSAGVSAYWMLGGGWLLDTVGGAIEDLARERSVAAIALVATIVVLKVFAGVLAIGLTRPAPRRLLLLANGAAAGVLCLWGGANVVVGALVLSGVIKPATEVDRHALRWHVFLWDMWFLIWGLALALALILARRRTRG
jgi:hypothetical protein